MGLRLRDLKESASAYASAFDAATLSGAQAAEVVRLCAQIRASISSVESRAAARLAAGGDWKTRGSRSAAEDLARRTGMSPTQARRSIETGRRLADQPSVAAAAASGQLSPEQAAMVAVGVEANPAKAEELIELARSSSLAELQAEVVCVQADQADREERYQAIKARRSLRRWTNVEGAAEARMIGTVDDAADLWKVLDQLRRRLIMLRTEADKFDRLDALDYDALMLIARVAAGQDGELSLADLLDMGLFPQMPERPLPQLPERPLPPVPKRPLPQLPERPSGPEPGSAVPGVQAVQPDLWAPPGDPAAVEQLKPDPAPVERSKPDPAAVERSKPDPAAVERSDPAPAAVERSKPDPAPADRSKPDPAAVERSKPDPAPVERSDLAPAPAGPVRAKKLAGGRTKVIVRVDLDALLRGIPMEGELCEIAGYGPVPVSVIRELLANHQTLLAFLLTSSQRVIGVASPRRHPNRAQQTALEFLYPSCAVAGCSTRAGLQADHRVDWEHTHYTLLDRLDMLCRFHHGLKTHQGWALVDGSGKRAFVPPGDPCHPVQVEPP